jgi:hypothetical protein
MAPLSGEAADEQIITLVDLDFITEYQWNKFDYPVRDGPKMVLPFAVPVLAESLEGEFQAVSVIEVFVIVNRLSFS